MRGRICGGCVHPLQLIIEFERRIRSNRTNIHPELVSTTDNLPVVGGYIS